MLNITNHKEKKMEKGEGKQKKGGIVVEEKEGAREEEK
jgi:hypothetical protein